MTPVQKIEPYITKYGDQNTDSSHIPKISVESKNYNLQ